MKIHRFYSGDLHDKRGKLDLAQKIWVHDKELLHQWLRVLRLRVREQIILFDGRGNDRLYKVNVVEPDSVGLELVTVLEPRLPVRHSYIFWSLLKKDNNDLVLQKCTELGITNFVPLLTARTEKTGFDTDRSLRIVIEAAEQCGRSDIPHIREPISLQEVIVEYAKKIELYVGDQEGGSNLEIKETDRPPGILIGPEGGWTDEEKQFFQSNTMKHLNMGTHTLRAETAAIIAAQLLQQNH